MNGVFPNGVYKITTAALNGVVSFRCGSTIICIIQRTESGYELTDDMVARQRKYLKAFHFLKHD